ncbi:sulfite oxidase-like [Tubulanus polymorphus]|uniref:sulfite oxidase-like n=1 Tax=Tubulanus polymorphus TaxID=672921 RepID=UPI003DA55BFC
MFGGRTVHCVAALRRGGRKLIENNPSLFITARSQHSSSSSTSRLRLSLGVKQYAPVVAAAVGLGGYLMYKNYPSSVSAKTIDKADQLQLPKFSIEEISKHRSKETGIWVTYAGEVFDITEFVDKHPGGDKILLAAGGALEPFWEMYAVHKESGIVRMLRKYRIGQINEADLKKNVIRNSNDPYANEPKRHPALNINSNKPFNAEPPTELITDNIITPNEIFFIRNHLAVPVVDPKKYVLEITGEGMKKPLKLSLHDLKTKFKKHKVVATMQCAGNRRAEMSRVKEVKGLSWQGTAISNAEWGGAKLMDVLKYAGVAIDDPKIKHVQFEGLDKDPTNAGYGASVPANLVFNSHGEALVAYEMNGVEIPPDHGYPARVIIPGTVGARNVKWVSKIVVSEKESSSHWQQNDYKGFSPSVDWGNADFSKSQAMIEAPVTSAICCPKDGSKLPDNEVVTIRGYAWSGGGRGIIRVDLSIDGGKTWFEADLENVDQEYNRRWAWSLWEKDLEIPKGHKGKLNIIAKAIDTSYNTQPDSIEGIWNLRGLINNAWHRINVQVPDDEE